MKLPLASGRLVMRGVKDLIHDYRGAIGSVVGLQLVSSLAGVTLPWLLGRVIDRIQAGAASRDWVGQQMVISLVVVAVAAIFSFLAEYRARVMGERIFAHLRDGLVDSVIHLPLSTVESAGTGDLVGRTTRDIERLQFMIRQGIAAILMITTTLVVTFVAAFLTSPLLAFMLLIGPLGVWPLMAWYLPRTVPAYRSSARSWADLSGSVAETLDQADTVDALGLSGKRIAQLDVIIREIWRQERYSAWMRSWLFMGIVCATLSPLIVIVLLGAWLVPSGALTIGAVSTIALYAYQVRGPVWEATFWVDVSMEAYTSLARIFGVAQVEPDREASAHAPAGTSSIVARDVCYAYHSGQNVLHEVSLELHGGETLAIVGPSGAGKSTFGRMLAGIHPPTSGSVTVGGVRLVDLPESELHQQVALVTQEQHVFTGTIASNLRLARPDASDEELWTVLDAVGVDWVRGLGRSDTQTFTALSGPEGKTRAETEKTGLHAEIGGAGMKLNPAQVQQLALARIVLLNPHTLVLDEATSLMDPSAARSLEQSLSRVLAGRSVVAIAHRLYTAHDADRVAVMMDGRIVELGTHDELVAAGGEYASLWESWQQD
ncbi:ABC transporter ATP-binding protein [Mobiluncus sp.]|uniref:ABC transporter ATP-binding protein n=1 Tax=Mobiluncus sp. TaxID=47293 RepID=UPI002A913959|nr:ABC transporter ATP-binding protein [Mobiluncus sp.]MDY6077434.1 ABC transporter ATP-binding protein [Mobiluncus sp.]